MSQEDILSYGDIESSYGLPSLGNLELDYGMTSKFHQKLINTTRTQEELWNAAKDNQLKKQINLAGYQHGQFTFSDADSGYMTDPETGQRVGFRLTGGTGSKFEYDALDMRDDPNKSEQSKAIQAEFMSRLLGKPVSEINDLDYMNVKNYQYNESMKSLTDKDYTFTPYDKNQVYNAETRPVNLGYKITGKDQYGRLLVEAVNPNSGRSASFDIALNPYLNTRNAPEGFNIFSTLDTRANRERLENYSSNRQERLREIATARSSGDVVSQFFNRVESALLQSGARALKYTDRALDELGFEKAIAKLTDTNWERITNTQLNAQEWADIKAGVKPSTRKKSEELNKQTEDLWNQGDYFGSLITALTNVDSLIADSSTMIIGSLATGGLASIGGAASIAARLGTSAAGRLLTAAMVTTPAALDATLVSADQFSENNNGERMSGAKLAEVFGVNLALLMPEAIFVALGLAKTLPSPVRDKVLDAYKLKALPGTAKTLGIGAVTGAATNAPQDIYMMYVGEKQDDPNRKGFMERLFSSEGAYHAMLGAVMNVGLAGVPSAASLPLALRSEFKRGKVAEVNTTIDKEFTPAYHKANEEFSQNTIDALPGIDSVSDLTQMAFHPELNKDAVSAILKRRNELLIKQGKIDPTVFENNGTTKLEAFKEYVFHADPRGLETNRKSKTDVKKEVLDARTEAIEKVAEDLKIPKEEVKKIMEEVTYDVRHGDRGYNTYIQNINNIDKELANKNLPKDRKDLLDKARIIQTASLTNIRNFQMFKLNSLSQAIADLATVGFKDKQTAQFQDRPGKFVVNRDNILNWEPQHKVGVYGLIDTVKTDIKNINDALSKLGIENTTDSNKTLESITNNINVNVKNIKQGIEKAAPVAKAVAKDILKGKVLSKDEVKGQVSALEDLGKRDAKGKDIKKLLTIFKANRDTKQLEQIKDYLKDNPNELASKMLDRVLSSKEFIEKETKRQESIRESTISTAEAKKSTLNEQAITQIASIEDFNKIATELRDINRDLKQIEEDSTVKPLVDYYKNLISKLSEKRTELEEIRDKEVADRIAKPKEKIKPKTKNEKLFSHFKDMIKSGMSNKVASQTVKLLEALGKTAEANTKGKITLDSMLDNISFKNKLPKMSKKMQRLFQQAWHGSPYNFEKFMLDHIGSGEGNQAYGWGLYFSSKRGISEGYRKTLSKSKNVRISINDSVYEMINDIWSDANGEPVQDMSLYIALFYLEATKGDINLAIDRAYFDMDMVSDSDDQMYIDAEMAAIYLENSLKSNSTITFSEEKLSGQLYKVEIPESDVLLNYDKTFEEQSPKVQKALNEIIKVINSEIEFINEDAIKKYGDDPLLVPDIFMKDLIFFNLGTSGKHIYEDISNALGIDANKAASELLNTYGIKGIEYIGHESRKTNFVIFDDTTIELLETFYQMQGNIKKGAIQFTGPHTLDAIIAYYKNGDASTPPHELAHFSRRLLQTMAEMEDASQQVKDDWKAANDFVESKLGEQWTTIQEEKFADAFLVYLNEGKAPNKELQSVFDRFAKWLSDIYNSVKKSLGVELNPEIRGVFDRLLSPVETKVEPTLKPKDYAVQAVLNTNSAKYSPDSSKPFDLSSRIEVTEPKSTIGKEAITNLSAKYFGNNTVKSILMKVHNLTPNIASLAKKTRPLIFFVGRNTKTGELNPNSMINSDPHLRIMYDFIIDNEAGTIDLKMNRNVGLAIDFSTREYFANMSTKLKFDPKKMQDIADLFGMEVNSEKFMDNFQTIKGIVGEYGVPRSTLEGILGKLILDNLGIRENESGIVGYYGKIASGLGSVAFRYAEANGWLVQKVYEKAAWEEKHDIKSPLEADKIPFVKFNQGMNKQIRDSYKQLEHMKKDDRDATKPLAKSNTVSEKMKTRHTNGRMTVPSFVRGVFKTLFDTPYILNTELADFVLNADNIKDIEKRLGILSEEELNSLSFDERESSEGINQSAEDTLENLKEFVKEIQGRNNESYFNFFFSKNGRIFIDSSKVNPQTNKFVRFLLLPERAFKKFDPKSEANVAEMHFAIGQAFDSLLTDERISEIAEKVIAQDTDQMMKDIIKMDEEAFKEKYKDTGIKGIENLSQALNVLQHIKKMKEANGKSFKTWLAVENDSTTSGYAIRFLQFPDETVKPFWEKVGIITDKSRNMEIHSLKQLEGFLDIYKSMAQAASIENIVSEKNITTIEDAELKSAKDLYENLSREEWETFDFVTGKTTKEALGNKEEIAKAKERLDKAIKAASKPKKEKVLWHYLHSKVNPVELTKTFNLMYNALPKPEADGSIGSALRKLFKDPAMIFGYTAGQRSIVTSLSNEISNSMVNDYIKLKDGIKQFKTFDAYLNQKLENGKSKFKDTEKAKLRSIEQTFNQLQVFHKGDLYHALKTKPANQIWLKVPSMDKPTTLARYFQSVLSPTYGQAVWDALQKSFGNFNEYNDSMNRMFNTMFQVFDRALTKRIDILKEKYKDEIPILEEKKVLDDLFDLYPTLSLFYDATKNNEGMLLIDTEKNKDLAYQSQSYYKDKDGVTRNDSVYADVRRFIDAGKAGAVLPIHFFDGMVMSMMLARFGNEMIGVHDASVMSAINSAEKTKFYNELLYTLGKDFNIYDELVTRFNEVMNIAEKEYGMEGIFDEVIPMNKKDSKYEYTVGEFINQIEELRRINNEARDKFYHPDNKPFIANMDGVEGSGYQVTGRESFKELMFIYGWRANPKASKKALGEHFSNPRTFTPTGVLTELARGGLKDRRVRDEIFSRLQDMHGKVENTEHFNNLRRLIAKVNPNNLENLSVYVTDYMESTAKLSGDEIIIGLDDGLQMDPVTRLSPYSTKSNAELYAHELIHAGIRYALANRDMLKLNKEISQLMEIQRQAMSLITWEDFMPDGKFNEGSRGMYESNAKDIWNYIFNNPDVKKLAGLHEFIAYGLTNEKVINKLKAKYIEGLDPTNKPKLLDRFISLAKSLLDIVSGKGKFSEVFKTGHELLKGNISIKQKDTMHRELLNLYDKINSINEGALNKLEEHPARFYEKMFSMFGTFAQNANKFLSPYTSKFMNFADEFGLAYDFSIPNTGSFFEYSKMYANIILFTMFSKQRQQILPAVLSKATGLSQQGVIASILRDITSPDEMTSQLEAMTAFTRMLDRDSNSIRVMVYANLAEGFNPTKDPKKALNDIQKKAITESMLRTDLGSLLEFDANNKVTNIDEVLDYLRSPEKVSDEITRLRSELDKTDYNTYYTLQAYYLSKYMTEGVGKENLNLTPRSIAEGRGTGTLLEYTENTVKVIDRLATMFALQDTNLNSRLMTADLNKTGLINFLITQNQFVKESMTDGTILPIHMMKGYNKGVYNEAKDIKVASIHDRKEMKKLGYKYLKTLADNPITGQSDIALYQRYYPMMGKRSASTVVNAGSQAQGANLKDSAMDILYSNNEPNKVTYIDINELSGVFKQNAEVISQRITNIMMNKKNSFEKSVELIDKISRGYTPIASPKAVYSDYRLTMSYTDKVKYMKMNEDALDIMSRMYASKNTKMSAPHRNKLITDFLINDMETNMIASSKLTRTGKDYVRLTPDSKNSFIREAYKVIPRELREAIKKYDKESDGFWVRNEWLAQLFGVPSTSLIDSPLVKKYTNNLTKHAIVLSEYVLKNIASMAKDNIVVRYPKVLIANIISNLNVSVANGNSPSIVIRRSIENSQNIRDYVDNRKALNMLEFKRRLNTATSEELSRINWHRAKIENNPVKPLMDKGMYQSIVEDIDLQSVNKFNQWIEFFTKSKHVPSSIRTVLKHVYMAEGTPLYDLMFQATQYSDFVARATEYQLRMERYDKEHRKDKNYKETDEYKKYEQDATNYVWNAFVNYDKPLSSKEQYLNDLGVLMFTKYMKRIVPTVFRGLAEKPFTSMLFLMSQSLHPSSSIFEYFPGTKDYSYAIHNIFDNFYNAFTPVPLQAATGTGLFK